VSVCDIKVELASGNRSDLSGIVYQLFTFLSLSHACRFMKYLDKAVLTGVHVRVCYEKVSADHE
jgi:hypothetical protein